MVLNIVLRHYTPSFLRAVYHEAYRFYYRTIGTLYRRCNSNTMSNVEFLKLTGFKTKAELVTNFKTRQKPLFFISSENQNTLTNLVKNNFPDSINTTIDSAEKVLNHTFDLLGSGEANLGQKIDWHLDFKVGRRWPLIHPKGIDVNEFDKPSDIKVPWELSRCQHFAALGKAYWLTKDDKYAEEFKNQVESWIKENPYGLGVNWLCVMEVAIRACNWIMGWCFFKESAVIDADFVHTFAKSLFQHGRHIMKNLENKGGVTSNHYLSDITGLVYLGFFSQNIEAGKKWRDFAISELINEMHKQINPDGMDFEGSTCYHRLVLELFFFPTLITVVNDDSFHGDYGVTARKIFGDEYVSKLYKMFEFVLYTLKPNGMMPQIGDNDNGRLHVFSDKEILDMRYLLDYGAIFFNESQFKLKEFGITEDALWIYGIEGFERWRKLPENSVHYLNSKAFPVSGIYVMRDDKTYIIVSCMSNGQNGNGGHNHNDVLSFELNVAGQDVIVDPGTHRYTGDYKMRNHFRSSTSHNTVVIDGQEINRFEEKRIFSMYNDAKPRVLRWEYSDGQWLIEAEHSGYMRLNETVIHNRVFIYCKGENKIRIKDRFSGEGKHKLAWNLILSPDIAAGLDISSKQLEWRKEDTFYSSAYGTINKTKKLTSKVDMTVPCDTTFELRIEPHRLSAII